MDQPARKLLESATLKTLHAHNFSRSSTQASQVLTDLLARYLTLLSASCAKYAQHAGRLRLTVRDAVSALDELGVGVDELSEYCATEARDLSRYAVHTARRIEDLNEFKASLAVGLREYCDDSILLEYARVESIPLYEDEPSEGEAELEELELQDRTDRSAVLDVDPPEQQLPPERPSARPLPPSPPLPLSPISNPSTPARKRPRTASWRPPPHVPDFLPPFPTDAPRHSPSPPPQDPSGPANSVKLERPASPPPQVQIASSASSADYLTRVPFDQSSLAGVRAWDLPPASPPSPPPAFTAARLPVPQTQPALLGAYHHVLTHPPPENITTVNPARYKVALAFLQQSEIHPRWEPAATLFSSSAPNSPRVAPIGPSLPIAIAKGPPTPPEKSEQDADKDRKPNLPNAPPRPVIPSERLTPLMSQQASRLPKLARQLLPGSVHTRTTRLTHPPVLQRATQKLVYGPGVNAPWNRSAAGTPAAPPGATKSKDGQGANGLPNGKDVALPPQVLPDARFFATWNYEQKRFNEPIAPRRGRMASMHGANALSLPPGRAESESRVS